MSTAALTQTDRDFVISHVDYRIKDEAQQLTEAQLWTLYQIADGFGKRTAAELRAINGGYDWSHFRDSSDEAFREMAFCIRRWLGLPQTTAARTLSPRERRSQAIRKLQNAQTRFLDNPSAENFTAVGQAMIAYQELIKS